MDLVCDKKDSDLLLDLERLSTLYWQGEPVFMDLNWWIHIFVVLVCGVLRVVSLGIFNIAALKPNWAELSGTTWREDCGELNWTGLKWRPFIPVFPLVWILRILIFLCTVWILSDQKWNTDLALRATSTFWLYNKYRNFMQRAQTELFQLVSGDRT